MRVADRASAALRAQFFGRKLRTYDGSEARITPLGRPPATPCEVSCSLVGAAQNWAASAILNSILIGSLWVAGPLKKALTPEGALHAGLLGTVVWTTLNWRGYAVVAAYFILGVAVTKIGIKRKEAEGIAEKRGGRRGPENVWGSAAVSTACALLASLLPAVFGYNNLAADRLVALLQLAYVASFSTKLADTVSSEVGKAYGKTTYLITSFKVVPRGTEGAVSAEGTLAGVAASVLLAALGSRVGLVLGGLSGVLVCVVSAFLANNVESYVGAALQGRPGYEYLTNELVNVINTACGALFSILAGALLLFR
eukprot:tig00021257_g19753.t1